MAAELRLLILIYISFPQDPELFSVFPHPYRYPPAVSGKGQAPPTHRSEKGGISKLAD